jgi:hypothetical protein
MNKLKTTAIGTGLIIFSYIANAQDFFNGMPGPKLTQSDSYASYNTKTHDLTGTYIQKVFPRLNENTNMLIALPIEINKKGIDLKGINLGIMKQKMFKKELYGTAALGVFKGDKRYPTIISPQIYFTALSNGFSVDLEGALNINIENKKINQKGSITLGYGNNRLRVGDYGKFSSNNAPEYGALARFDITKNHKFWSELYVNNKSEIKFRLASNFF